MTIQDLQQLLTYVYAESITKAFNSLVKEHCVGCQYDHPSQKHHLCIDPHKDTLSPVLYELATERVDKFNLKLLFIEAAKSLLMDYRVIDFHQYLNELESFWRLTEWSKLEESISVPEYVVLAVVTSRVKLLLLEKRIQG